MSMKCTNTFTDTQTREAGKQLARTGSIVCVRMSIMNTPMSMNMTREKEIEELVCMGVFTMLMCMHTMFMDMPTSMVTMLVFVDAYTKSTNMFADTQAREVGEQVTSNGY